MSTTEVPTEIVDTVGALDEEVVNTEEGVTGIQVMNDDKVKELMFEIKDQEPIGKGSFKKVYKLNDNEVVSVEVNMKRKKREEKKTETEFEQKEKDDYEKIMKTMHDLDPEHKKYLLLPTEYGYSSDGKTRVQILPYCNQNGGKCLDLINFLEGKCTDDQSTIMTDCVNILKTIHKLHQTKIVCMDIKPENTFISCPSKAFLSLGDTDGFKLMGETRSCSVTPGYYVKQGHFITDYYAWLQVFLIVYISVQKGNDAAVKLYNNNLRELHGEMYMLRKSITAEKAREKIKEDALIYLDTPEQLEFMEELINEYSDDKAVLYVYANYGSFSNKRRSWLTPYIEKKETSVHEDYKKLIKEILEKLSPCVNSILKALKACVDAKNIENYDEKEFYQKYIEPITKKTMFGRVGERMRKFKFNPFASRIGGRKSKKSSRGKKKKTRRKKKTTRRKKKKTRRKKKKSRGKKRR